MRQEAGDELDEEHRGVDSQHDLQHAPLARRDIGDDLAAAVQVAPAIPSSLSGLRCARRPVGGR